MKSKVASRGRIIDLPKKREPLLAPEQPPSDSSLDDEAGAKASSEEDNISQGDLELDEDAEGPRVSQWVDMDDDEVGGLDHEDGLGEPDQLGSLQKDLSSVPFSALLKARSKLAVDDSEHPESDDASTDSNAANDHGDSTDRAGRKQEWSLAKKAFEKRANKHAPVEVTSKRPVPRFRPVVEMHKAKARDPRFQALSGQLSSGHFNSSYSFLPELHVSELETLKSSLVRARKLLATSPRDLRAEREAEVSRLELAVERAQSTVERERRQKIEGEAVKKVEQEERQKRKEGKGKWYLKDSEKKAIKLRARYDDLAATGRPGAVKKAIEKKQRKVAQKEKKSRPFAPPPSGQRDLRTSGEHSAGSKARRPSSASSSARPKKKRRVE